MSLSRLAVAVAILALAPAVAAAPALSVGTVAGAAGATINLPVTLTNDSAITALQFDLLFDSASISSVGTPAKGTAIAATDHVVDSNLVSAGRFRVVVLSNSLAAVPSGQIVVVPMTIAAGASSGALTITLSDVEMVDANATVFGGSSSNGTVTVGTVCVQGDVAPDGVGNGSVSTADFVLSRRKALGGAAAQNARDATCGNVAPGVETNCGAGVKKRWCSAPNTTGVAITTADVVTIRRVVLLTHELTCSACGAAPQVARGGFRVPGDIAPRGAGDGRVDVGDVVLALRYSVGLEAVTADAAIADVAPAARGGATTLADGNGSVDVADVVLLLRAAVGLESLDWATRTVDIVLANAQPRVGFSVVVGGWPATAQVLGVQGSECGNDESGLESSYDGWGVACVSDPQVVSTGGAIASVTYRGPRVSLGTLQVSSELVSAALNETRGQLSLVAR